MRYLFKMNLIKSELPKAPEILLFKSKLNLAFYESWMFGVSLIIKIFWICKKKEGILYLRLKNSMTIDKEIEAQRRGS
jgi:hypothetical protein